MAWERVPAVRRAQAPQAAVQLGHLGRQPQLWWIIHRRQSSPFFGRYGKMAHCDTSAAGSSWRGGVAAAEWRKQTTVRTDSALRNTDSGSINSYAHRFRNTCAF